MRGFEAIHFDMDGVLADTEPYHVQAEIQTCFDHGFDVDPNAWDGFKGRTAEDIFTYLIQKFGDPKKHEVKSLIGYKTDIFLELTGNDIRPIEGVMEFLQWAREKHPKMSLVTSSNRRVQEHIVDSFGIRRYFDHIITGDDIENGKPHPEPYIMATNLCGISAGKSIVIEDSKSGIQSAMNAGCAVLAIATSHKPEELAEANPTLIAIDYVDARQQIESLRVF